MCESALGDRSGSLTRQFNGIDSFDLAVFVQVCACRLSREWRYARANQQGRNGQARERERDGALALWKHDTLSHRRLLANVESDLLRRAYYYRGREILRTGERVAGLGSFEVGRSSIIEESEPVMVGLVVSAS